jgi:hypothetical protein
MHKKSFAKFGGHYPNYRNNVTATKFQKIWKQPPHFQFRRIGSRPPNFSIPEVQCELIALARASFFVMAILIHPHARERMEERETSEDEVRVTISQGERFPAKLGRAGFKRNFPFESKRDGKFFRIKQVVVYGVGEGEDFLVITVVVKYF